MRSASESPRAPMRTAKAAGGGSMCGRSADVSELSSRSKKTAPGRRADSWSGRQSRPSSRQLASTIRRSASPRRSARSAAVMSGLSGMAARLRLSSGLRQRQLNDVGAAEAEAGLAIGQVEAPQAAEALVEAGHAADFGPRRLEALVPELQGLGVVAAEPLHRSPGQAGAVDHGLQRG